MKEEEEGIKEEGEVDIKEEEGITMREEVIIISSTTTITIIISKEEVDIRINMPITIRVIIKDTISKMLPFNRKLEDSNILVVEVAIMEDIEEAMEGMQTKKDKEEVEADTEEVEEEGIEEDISKINLIKMMKNSD